MLREIRITTESEIAVAVAGRGISTTSASSPISAPGLAITSCRPASASASRIAPDWTTLGTWPSAAAQQEAASLYQADPSGSRAGCLSVDAVADLTGNVAEWTRRSSPTAAGYDHVLKGCYWSKCYGGSEPSCGFVNGAHPGTFRTYEAGFRCCLGGDP